MPREASKTRKWQQERRDRLKDGFNQLSKVLPSYDPSITVPRLEVLHSAAKTIKSLDDKLKNLLSPESDEKAKKERADVIKRLRDRVRKLLIRNEQLSNLIRDAGITVPSECGTVKKIRNPLLWSNRIRPEQSKLLQQKELEKQTATSTVEANVRRKQFKSDTKTRKIYTNTAVSKKVTSRKRNKDRKVPPSKCVILLSQPAPINPQCFIITNAPSSGIVRNNTNSQTVITNSGLLTTPLVSSTIKSSGLVSNHTVPVPTLILTNRPIVPILQQPQTIFPASNLISNSFTINPRPTVVVFTTASGGAISKNATTSTTSSLTKKTVLTERPLQSIRPKRCLTNTTQINKVPIPALTSSYSRNIGSLTENKSKPTPNKVVKKENKVIADQNQSIFGKGVSGSHGVKRSGESCDLEPDSKKLRSDKQDKSPNKEKCKKDDNTEKINLGLKTAEITSDSHKESDDAAAKRINVSEEMKQVTNICENIVPEQNTITSKPLKPNPNATESLGSLNQDTAIISSAESKSTESYEKEIARHNNMSKVLDQFSYKNPDQKTVPSNLGVTVTISENVVATTKTVETPVHLESQSIKNLELNLSHSELSNDLFASLQVPPGCQNPDSTSPTAAFLLAFPLVSSGVKVTEVIDGDNSESQRGTPNLLQIGTIESNKPIRTNTESLTPNLLNLDNFSFFSGKDNCGGFYNNYSNIANTVSASTLNTSVSDSITKSACHNREPVKVLDENTKKISQYNSVVKNAFTTSNAVSSSSSLIVAKSAPTGNNVSYHTGSDLQMPIMQTSNSASVRNVTDFCIKSDILKTNININATISDCTLPCNEYQGNKKSDVLHLNMNQKQNYVNNAYNASCQLEQKVTSSFSSNGYPTKNYNSLYTNSNNYGCNYQADTNFNQNYYKNITKNDTKTYYPLNYENYTDYRNNETQYIGNYSTGTQASKEKYPSSVPKGKVSASHNKPVNWMTTPNSNSNSFRSDYLLNSFSKESEFGHSIYTSNSLVTSSSFIAASTSGYFNTPSLYTISDVTSSLPAVKKTFDLPLPAASSYQRTEVEDIQFSWSPTKLPQFLDPPHNFVSATLPTLVGDLALNNPSSYGEQKPVKDKTKDTNKRKTSNYENQSNFLSVRQLVDHNKDVNVPATASARRNSGSRLKNATPKAKRCNVKPENKDMSNYNVKVEKPNQPKHVTQTYNLGDSIFYDQKSSKSNKNVPSSYSAEALIGHQNQTDGSAKRFPSAANKSVMPSFLTENIIPYFPPVDENNYMQQNQNYQANSFSHNFPTSFQSNSYPSNSFMPAVSTSTTTYLSSNSFMHDINSHDYGTENFLQTAPSTKDKHCKSYMQHKEDKSQNNCTKKSKKRGTNDNGLPNFDFPFLSMPGGINSPILPDDFHSHTSFLPSTTLYPCKNPLYPKQNPELGTSTLLPPLPPVPVQRGSGIQHSNASPMLNPAGTSLTNFNLSTIFPEINKGPLPDIYSDSRENKHNSVPSNFTTNSAQVSFNNKPTFSFGSTCF